MSPNKVVIITGASRGIGAACTHEYIKNGYIVCIIARSNNLQKVKNKCLKYHPDAKIDLYYCDVTKLKELEQVYRSIYLKYKRIDIVIANAGINIRGTINSLEVSDYYSIIDTNIIGVINTVKLSINYLSKTKGRIAISGSIAGYLSYGSNSAYCLTKMALVSFANTVRHELEDKGISVSMLTLGFIDTEIHDDANIKLQKKQKYFRWLKQDVNIVARIIIRSIQKRKKNVIVGFATKLLYIYYRLFPFSSGKTINNILKN